MYIESINPVDYKPIKKYREYGQDKVRDIIDQTHHAFLTWKKHPHSHRVECLKKASEILLSRKEEFAKLITLEMGKPIVQSRQEIEKCAWGCRYYADNTKLFLVDEPIVTEASNSFVSYEPLGIILAIMPWNFPFWQVFRFAAPAIMAGNGCLLKHASNVPGCALAIEDVFRESGIDEHLFSTLLLEADKVEGLLEDDRISAVTLSGSELAGAKVAELSGRNIKKTVLELGGSDPFIILEDADLKTAVKTAVKSRMINSGQSCIAAKRFIVIETIAPSVIKLLKKEIANLKVGDPMDEATDIGPMARKDLLEKLHHQVLQSIKKGAKLVLGGKPVEGSGAFYQPTLLKNVKPGMPAFDDETFGPVASVIVAKDCDHAIELANQSRYGLGASIWTEDKERGTRLARQLHAGCVFVNEMVKSDPRMPFGGIKKSGYGRELSQHALKEFVNIKSIWVN